MSLHRKSGLLKAVDEGKARVRLATLERIDADGDAIESGFFPVAPPLIVSIQPFHNMMSPASVMPPCGKTL